MEGKQTYSGPGPVPGRNFQYIILLSLHTNPKESIVGITIFTNEETIAQGHMLAKGQDPDRCLGLSHCLQRLDNSRPVPLLWVICWSFCKGKDSLCSAQCRPWLLLWCYLKIYKHKSWCTFLVFISLMKPWKPTNLLIKYKHNYKGNSIQINISLMW